MKHVHISIFLAVCFLSSCDQKSTNERLPNIVFIFADDLGYGDIGAFGAVDIKTPNIDRLAIEGTKFTDFYSASPVCSPSRAGLMTGRIPQRMGINSVFFPESFTGMPASEITIAEMLREKNYKTGIVGKWHLGHRQEFLPLQQGFDEYFGIPYSNDMAAVVYMRGNVVESFKVDQHLTTRTYTEEALKFIDAHHQNQFFLYVAHNMPHVPIYASEDFAGSSGRGLYGDVIQEIDWSVGEIIKKLEDLNLLENTLIVFSSDNGPWLVMEDYGGSAGVLREGKQFTFDGGVRVPTVAMWKGKIPPGQTFSDVATQMDWFPTFSAMVDSELPDRAIDGKDLSDVLFHGGSRDGDTFLFFDGAKLEGFRKGDWKVKLPYNGYEGSPWKKRVAPHDTLLIDMNLDPGEQANLYRSNPQKTIDLIEEMHRAYTELGDLPPSLIVRGPQDNSHFAHLEEKRRNQIRKR